MMPGAPNASMARQVEQAGFDAVYISGAGMANSTAGVPDIGLLTRDEVVRLAGYAAHAVRIPAIIDADTGFGEGKEVAKKIREVEIIPGKGSGQLRKKVERFLQQPHIKTLYHRIENDSKNFGRLFVYFKF